MACSLPSSSVHGDSHGLGGLPCPPPVDLPNSGTEPRSPVLQADSLPAEPQGKLRNTGVGSISLLQWIFPTQELNRGLLHCRGILYQLSGKQDPIPKSESRELLGVAGSHPVLPQEPHVLDDTLMSQLP